MSDPAMWSRAKQVATYIVRDWMLLDATERTMDKLVEEIELELDKAFDDGMKAVVGLSQPLIRAAALEEAAKVAEESPYQIYFTNTNIANVPFLVRGQVAAGIRALIHSNQPPPSDSA